MQASCPQCSQKIVIDDAKVPDRPFSVKCPKCQNVVKFPGRAAVPAPPPPADDPFAGFDVPAAPPSGSASFRSEVGQGKRALVALADRDLASSVGGVLGQLSYAVENLDNPDEGARLIEQGVYALAVTALGGGQGRETLYQRIGRQSPDTRRRIFVAVVGDEFTTGDGVQAWSVAADLVVNPRDSSTFGQVLNDTLGERTRLYQAYLDARRRFEESAG